MCVCVCVCVCVFVCVEHLNRCKTFHVVLLSRGSCFFLLMVNLITPGAEHSGNCTQRSYPLVLEAESDQLCVPAISTSTLFLLQWHGAKPIIPKTILHRLRFCTVFAIWFYSDFHTTGLSFSPFQNPMLHY